MSAQKILNYFSGAVYEGGGFQFAGLMHHLTKNNVEMPVAKSGNPIVLDAGCGDGKFSEWLLETVAGSNVIGFDLSRKQIEAAIERNLKNKNRAKFIVGSFDDFKSVEALPQVDMAFANYSLHLAPSLKRAITNIASTIRAGGHFCATVPLIRPFISLIYEELVHDPMFAEYLLPFHDQVDHWHPNGLKFWEESGWLQPDAPSGFANYAMANDVIPINCSLELRPFVRDEETWKKLIHGIDPFLESIPDHLKAVYKAKTLELMKPTMLSYTENDGTVISLCPELFFYGVKRE